MENVSLTLARSAGGRGLECRVEVNDLDLLGHEAAITLEQVVEVKDSRPVNQSKNLLTRRFDLSSRDTIVFLTDRNLPVYTYRGSKIDVELRVTLTVDNGFVFDTKVTEEEELLIGSRPNISGDARSMIEPPDSFDFLANLKAIPFRNQIVTMILAILGAMVIAGNTLVGIHDQLVPEPATYFYSHRDSDGDSESPFFNSLAASGALGAGVWLLMRSQLRKYMSFRFQKLPTRIRPGQPIPIRQLVRGRSRVTLENVTLRVVACNLEKGQYKRGSGTKERTVSFEEPVRALLLYSYKARRIPAFRPVQRFFDGAVSFDPIFSDLFPPQQLSDHHGLFVHWEVQLLHDVFVDQELAGPSCFDFEDFELG